MVRIKIASLVKFYIFLLLLEKPKYGYEIMKELGRRIGKKVGASQVYPFLALLVKERLIRIEEGSRNKTVYSLTEEGKFFANKMLSRSGDLLYLALKHNIRVCAHCACKVISGEHKQKINGKEYIFCCSSCAKTFKEEL